MRGTFNTSTISVVTLEGNPWLVPGDACQTLGLSNTKLALRPLDPNERSTLKRIKFGMAGGADINITSESGLYKRIMHDGQQ